MATWACPSCREIVPLFEALVNWASEHGVDGNFVCRFCSAVSPNPHAPDCLHKLSLEYRQKEHNNGGGNQERDKSKDRQVGK